MTLQMFVIVKMWKDQAQPIAVGGENLQLTRHSIMWQSAASRSPLRMCERGAAAAGRVGCWCTHAWGLLWVSDMHTLCCGTPCRALPRYLGAGCRTPGPQKGPGYDGAFRGPYPASLECSWHRKQAGNKIYNFPSLQQTNKQTQKNLISAQT